MTRGRATARGRGLLLRALRFYQRAVSPNLPPRCRFTPTCSAYALEAIERYGARRGGWLAVRRLLRCAPWHPGGVDVVPEHPAGRGTDPAGQSSGTTVGRTAATPAGARRPHRATPPAPSRTPQQEAGVA